MLEFPLIDVPAIHTERLILRRITNDDAESVFNIRSDERTMRFLDRKRMESHDEALQLIKRMEDSFLEKSGIAWGITTGGNNILIGTIGYWRMEKEHYRAEIGYLLHPDHWRKGIMTEAMKAVVDFGFGKMNLHSIEANVNPENEPSIKLLERAGFKKEAHFKENYFYDGKFLDSAIYCLVNKG